MLLTVACAWGLPFQRSAAPAFSFPCLFLRSVAYNAMQRCSRATGPDCCVRCRIGSGTSASVTRKTSASFRRRPTCTLPRPPRRPWTPVRWWITHRKQVVNLFFLIFSVLISVNVLTPLGGPRNLCILTLWFVNLQCWKKTSDVSAGFVVISL